MKYSKEIITQLNNDIEKYFPNIVKIKSNFVETLNNISRLVMLDRYAQKDKNLVSLQINNIVMVSFKSQQNFQTKIIGKVKEIKKFDIVVLVEDEYVKSVSKNYIVKHSKNLISVSSEFVVKPLELYWEQISLRVAKYLAIPENDYKSGISSNDFEKMLYLEILNKKIIPAGRVLFGAGSNTNVTYFNCFVLPFIHDSRIGIAEHRQVVMEIMSRGGGVGTNGSTLRPRNEIVNGVNGHSSGSVSWLNDIANLTHLVEQGGSRRGAQMIMLADWHPDIINFIISKMQNVDILLYLWKSSNDKKIRTSAREKLCFVPPSADEKSFCKVVLKNKQLFSKKEIERASRINDENGTWKVKNSEFLSGANISVTITDEFIKAIKENKSWKLKFPDLATYNNEQNDIYNKYWHNIGDIRAWERMGCSTKTYYTIAARDLWNLITFCATYSAEPGVFFIDTANKYTNAIAYQQKVIATNPCGEQPLPPWAVCNLSAINLAKFVNYETSEIQYKELEKSVRICVRMQDNVITQTPYFLSKNKDQALGERRIGLGVMGLHDLLIFAGYKYGSAKSLNVIDKIFKKICVTAYDESINLAIERGSFPFLKSREDFVCTGFVSKLPEYIRVRILKHGIRNSHLLTVAPTGTTGTLADVSTGLEPYFAFHYYRSGRLGESIEINASILSIYKKYHPELDVRNLPEIFVTATSLSPEQHVSVQLKIQRWIDSSISKTVNAPNSFTTADVEKIYLSLYDGDAKGGTVYVDGSRNFQVLNLLSSALNVEQKVTFSNKNKRKISNKSIIETSLVSPDKLNRDIGTNVDDICALCSSGVLVMQNGCATCANCNAQLKCNS